MLYFNYFNVLNLILSVSRCHFTYSYNCSTNNGTVKPVLNGISRDQNIFLLKPGFRLIKVHYI